MTPDTLRRLRYLNFDIDFEKRERYLLDKGAIIRGPQDFHNGSPKGLVTFDIETEWIPEGLRELLGRPEILADTRKRDFFEEVEADHIARVLPIHTLGAHKGRGVVHYNDGPDSECGREAVGVFIAEELEPAEVILGYNVLLFDLTLLSRYTDTARLVMKTVDLHEEIRPLFRELVTFGGNPEGRISLTRLAKDNLDVRVRKPEVGRPVPLAVEMRKCEQDILITMELYRMYLEGSLCVEEKWKKRTVKERLEKR